MKICTLNKIAPCGIAVLGEKYTVSEELTGAEGVLVRSASLHETPLPESLLAIARAGAGVNNIPVDACTAAGIAVFNTPGANANAVKELVLAGLLLSCRDIVGGIAWAKTLKGEGENVPKLVEKGKSAYAGPELAGKTLGVIGLGAIGMPVAQAARALGMKVYGCKTTYTPEIRRAMADAGILEADRETILRTCDFITLHVPLNAATRGMLNREAFEKMVPGVRIMNFSRAEIVDLPALKEALASGKVAGYVVDFPTDEALDVPGILAIPHLGASTPESEDNCAVMAAGELKDYLENGNVVNSVNFPALTLPRAAAYRLCLLHRANGSLDSAIAAALSEAGAPVAGSATCTRGELTYALYDFAAPLTHALVTRLSTLDGMIRVRAL